MWASTEGLHFHLPTSVLRFFSSIVVSTNQTSASFFFFFQAEDGIRDLTVTGVQTCALPICAACLRLRQPQWLAWLQRPYLGADRLRRPRGRHAHAQRAQPPVPHLLGARRDRKSVV